jgi:nucleotide-binding universal stress UspA family protein
MKTLLVPLDGSAFAEQAVETARALAHRTGARIDFVSVFQPAVPLARLGGAPSGDARLQAELRENVRAYLARIETAERARSSVEIRGVLREGSIAAALEEHAVESGADLVVMTTHGRGGADRLLLGSIADRVIRASPVPVLLVRAGDPPVAGPVPLRQVVVAVAGVDEDDRVRDAATTIADQDRAVYTLVHVLDVSPTIGASGSPLGPPPDEMAGVPVTREEGKDHAAVRYLEWMAGPLRARGAAVATEVLRAASVSRAILDAAREAHADLIVVGTAARSPIARLFLGSTADKVIRGATCSVLVVPRVWDKGREVRL